MDRRSPVKFTVLAASIGKPKWHSMKGHQVESAIERSPTSIPLILDTTEGIVGHRSAAHDAQVYILFAHTYERWISELDLPESSWDWCHWGENLTVRTEPRIDESSIRVGDVWRFGQGVRLQVVGSRVPCSRLAWRCGQQNSWLKALADSGCCGVYLRVLEGGKVGVGDSGEVETWSSSNAIISDIPKAAFGENSAGLQRNIEVILGERTLIKMNRTYLQRKLNLLQHQEGKKERGWSGWRKLYVSRVTREKGDSKSFYLMPKDGRPLPTYSPGQYLPVRLPNGLVRCWSISDWTGNGRIAGYRLTIKKGSNASKWIHEAETHNLALDARSPRGEFHVDDDSLFAPRQLYISAGIGITPIFAMLKAHLIENGLRDAPALWIHVTKNSCTFTFDDQLPKLPDHVEMVVFFTQPLPGKDRPGVDYDVAGRPDLSYFKSMIQKPYFVNPMGIKPIQMDGHLSSCFICGPTSFERDVRSYLLECSVPPPLIRHETFEQKAMGDENSVPDIEEAVISFSRSNKEATWSSKEPVFLLEVARRAGLNPDFGCEQGLCGSCESKLICGSVKGGAEAGGERVLICSAWPSTNRVELDL